MAKCSPGSRRSRDLQLPFSLLVQSSHSSRILQSRHEKDQINTPTAAPSDPEGNCAIVVGLPWSAE